MREAVLNAPDISAVYKHYRGENLPDPQFLDNALVDSFSFPKEKIIDQVWRGISAAKVLVAELTGRHPNVFYELGLAHALEKPVVLVSSNEEDVPFDLQHIRVIYYDVKDPFWGQKLIDKISENIVSAIKNPEEATFKKIASSRNSETRARAGPEMNVREDGPYRLNP